MPSKPFSPNRKSLYPDTSTISMVFRDDEGLDSQYRVELKHAIELASRKGNLCLSHAHLMEFARMQCRTRHAVVSWLTQLPIVWIKGVPDIIPFEIEAVAASVAGHIGSRPSVYFSSFLNSLSFKPDDSPRYIIPNVLAVCVEAMAESKKFLERQEENFRDVWLPFSKDLVRDSRMIREAAIPFYVEQEIIDRKFMMSMESEVTQMLKGEMHTIWRLSDFRSLVIQHAPFRYVLQNFIQGRKKRMDRKDPNSKNFEREERSTSIDAMHMVGAAYCDIHVCDKRNRADLGHVRAELGKPKSLVWTRDTRHEFLDALRAPFLH